MDTDHSAQLAVKAVDCGGTVIKLGIVLGSVVLAGEALEAHSDEGLAPQLERIAASLEKLERQAGISTNGDLAVALPSTIQPGTTRVLDSFGKYVDAQHLDLAGWARDRLGARLLLENDARLALLGEVMAGAGRGCADVALLLIGTGIGTAVTMGGRLLRGARGQAGIMGRHLTVRVDGPPCVCGNRGCAEACASTAALRRDGDHDYRDIFRAAAAGDPAAGRQRDEAIAIWGAAAVNLVHAHDVERLIVGGGAVSGQGT